MTENGGRIVTFEQVPRDYVLASGGDKADASANDDAHGQRRSTD
jgi:nitrous oxide reductase accessory protein NosL